MWLMARACFYDFLLPRLTLRVQLLNPQLLHLRAPLRTSPLIKEEKFVSSFGLSDLSKHGSRMCG